MPEPIRPALLRQPFEPARRRFLRVAGRALAALGLAAIAGPALAHAAGGHAAHAGGGHAGHERTGHAAGTPGRGPLLPPRAVSWSDATCAFCGMTVATPAGAPQGEGFRERTYAQWVVAEDPAATDGAHHFESIACAINYAYVHGLEDGAGATLYVTDAGGSLPASVERLLPARQALFHWGEHLRVAMNARLLAFADAAAREAHALSNPDEGRQASYRLPTLEDLAPLPEMNLIALLARHAGLTG
jgi:hypothetical protein